MKKLKTLSFRDDAETQRCKNYTTIYLKKSIFTSVKKLLKSIVLTGIT